MVACIAFSKQYKPLSSGLKLNLCAPRSDSRVSNPFYFDTDPDPRIRTEKYGSGIRLRILILPCKGNFKCVSPQILIVEILLLLFSSELFSSNFFLHNVFKLKYCNHFYV